jgi:hypothetical protein
MVNGQPYTFTFNDTGALGYIPNESCIQKVVAADSNFGSPTPGFSNRGWFSSVLTIPFVYQGAGSTVQAAAGEMQAVLNSGLSGSFAFVGAQAGTNLATPSCQQASCALGKYLPWIVGAIALIAVAFAVTTVTRAKNLVEA